MDCFPLHELLRLADPQSGHAELLPSRWAGEAPTPSELAGNVLSNFAAELFEAAMTHGAFPIAESSGPYPKQ